MKSMQKKVKRAAALLLAALLFINSVDTSASTAYAAEVTAENFTYTEYDTTVTIKGYTGNNSEVVIPEQINGKKVTSIGSFAFMGQGNITSITIPSSVTNIGGYAFYSCRGLNSITIPAGVTSIGDGAFANCGSLTEIKVEESNSYYASEGGNCIIEKGSKKLIVGCQSTVIPAGVTSIGSYAFWNCENLTEIIIPEGVTSIESSAFFNCEKLTSVRIPSSVTSIAETAISFCKGLTDIKVEKGNPVYTSEDSNCIIESASNKLVLGCQNTVIPPGVTSIGDYAFFGYGNLTETVIPSGVTSIGKYAFGNCGISSITIPSGVTSIGKYAFGNCESLSYIKVEEGNPVYTSDGSNCIIEKASKKLIFGCDNTVIPSGVTSIGESAFEKCNGLTRVIIPESVTSIEKYAFYDCSNLTGIIIPSGVTSIDASSFTGCDELTIYCAVDSYAQQYAVNNNIPYSNTCPHFQKESRNAKAVTCTEEGYTGDTYCKICGECLERGKAVEAYGHSKEDELRNVKEATCTEAGYTGDMYCKRCEECIEKGESIEAFGHSYTEKVTKEPTEIEEGEKTYICSRCNYSYAEKIAKLVCNHAETELRDAKEATCTEAGYTGDMYCKICEECIKKGKRIVALGHSYTEKVTKEPTADAEGEKTYTCSRCNDSYTEPIAKLVSGYTVKFSGNGSTSGKMKQLSNCKYGKTYKLKKNKFKKKGYTFTGWNTKKDGSGKKYKNKAKIKNLTKKSGGKVTLYAQWKVKKYKITYKLKKGKNNKKNPSSYTVRKKTITLKKATKKGYKFKGWYSNKKCTKKVKKIKKGSTGKVRLYAKWKKTKK